MNVFGSHLSCGIQEICNFPLGEPAAYAIKELERRAKDIKQGRVAAMGLISLNRRQFEVWDKHLVKAGFKKVGRTVRNPNSGNDIRLYCLQREGRTSKKKANR